jgi:hypothetical protein
MTWALWHFAKNSMTCDVCRNAQEAKWRKPCPGIDDVDECPTNEVPKLDPANSLAVELFYKMLPGIQNGMGGWDYGAITMVFDVCRVKEGERQALFDKCLVMIGAIKSGMKTEG